MFNQHIGNAAAVLKPWVAHARRMFSGDRVSCARRSRACPSARVPLLLITILALVSLMGVHAANVRKEIAAVQTYILPILRYGPSNQKRDLRQLAAIAKQLECGFLLTGIFQHYADIKQGRELELAGGRTQHPRRRSRAHRQPQTGARLQAVARQPGSRKSRHQRMTALQDSLPQWHKSGSSCFNFSHPHFMPFDQLLDRSRLQAWLDVLAVDELKSRGWDGHIDALMYKDGAEPYELSGDVVHVRVKSPMWCDKHAIDRVKAQVRQFRVVAVVLFALNKPDPVDFIQIAGSPPQQACARDIYMADRMLRAAPWIQGLARQYIEQYLAGQPYLAVHVRPYPDTCLQGWKADQLEDAYLEQHCKDGLGTLHQQLGPKVAQVMQRTALTRLFVMAHPGIRATINRLLAQVGIEPHWLTAAVLSRLAGCTDDSSTFMAMAEEEVAVQAHTFIGTASSSITHSIAVGRMGNGSMNNFYLERLW